MLKINKKIFNPLIFNGVFDSVYKILSACLTIIFKKEEGLTHLC